MAEVLIIESLSTSPPQEIYRADEGTIVVGRSADAEVSIDSNSVSRRHCHFSKAGSQWGNG